MMTCKHFARLVASLPVPSERGLYARLRFWLHWAICEFCRRYWKELNAIGRTQRAQSDFAQHPTVKLSDVQKRLREKLLKGAA